MIDESSNTRNVQARMSSKIRHLVDQSIHFQVSTVQYSTVQYSTVQYQSIHFQLLLSEDGSGRGAGLAAAVAAAAT